MLEKIFFKKKLFVHRVVLHDFENKNKKVPRHSIVLAVTLSNPFLLSKWFLLHYEIYLLNIANPFPIQINIIMHYFVDISYIHVFIQYINLNLP